MTRPDPPLSIVQRVDHVLRVYGLILPGPVRDAIRDMARELEQLRADINRLKGTP
jgi:hypothetical protein